MLSSLHWLPVRYRIDFKIILFVFKSLNGLAPEYLSDLIQLHQPSKALRSASQVVLDVPRSFLKSRGDRAFSFAAPTLWNALPLSLRTANSLSSFKTLLKTHFSFSQSIAGCWFCMGFNSCVISLYDCFMSLHVFIYFYCFYCFDCFLFCVLYCEALW